MKECNFPRAIFARVALMFGYLTRKGRSEKSLIPDEIQNVRPTARVLGKIFLRADFSKSVTSPQNIIKHYKLWSLRV